MNPLDAIFTVAGIGVWSWWMLGFEEWTDFHGDVDRARQERMGRIQLQRVRFIAWMGENSWSVWGTGTATIAIVGFAIPDATSLAGILVGGVMWARSLGDEQEEPLDIQQLRAALGDVVKDPDNPPTVLLDGEDSDGEPLRAHIGGHPNFKEYTKAHRDALENVIEYRLKGDWEVIDWFGDGSSVWERVIHPPTRVDYTRHYDLPWHQIPVGPDGNGDMGIMDLRKIPHWLIAGATRHGKTSALRVALAHLLRFDVEVIAMDIKGGLGFLRNRSKVRICATRDINKIAEAMAVVLVEIEERADLFDHGKPYRKPLIVVCDELAGACERANNAPKTIEVNGKSVPNPTRQFVPNLETGTRLGAQGRVFFLLSTQRPSANAMPIEARDNAEGRLAIGPLGDEAAQMMFENEWARATNTASIPGRLVLGEMHGHGSTWRQGLWLADPHDTDHDTAERDRADNLLPPVITAGTTLPDSGDSDRIKDLDKSRTDGSATDEASRSDASSGSPSAETPYERYKRLKREGVARHRAEVRRQLRNPDCEWHGTKKGYEYGCRCDRCRAWYEMSKQKVSA